MMRVVIAIVGAVAVVSLVARGLEAAGVDVPQPFSMLAGLWGYAATFLAGLAAWFGLTSESAGAGESEGGTLPGRPPADDVSAGDQVSEQAVQDIADLQGEEVDGELGDEIADVADDLRERREGE